MWGWWKRHRRRRAAARPFPEEWLGILSRNVAHFSLITDQQRAKLCRDLSVLVAEKYWEGCRGLAVTDEVKVTIAAQACLMLLGRNDHDYFARVLTVLVYPSAFREADDGKGSRIGWAGQTMYRGPVIVAWDAALGDGRDCSLGHNVVIHEFAHQLDYLDGGINGTPDLGSDGEAEDWARIMTAEYTRLLRDLRKGRETFLGEYAATNETEFFSVASERFFTRPHRLRRYHRSLYELLRGYYQVDPGEWFNPADETA
jgi:Mlc titration factor MtfA (ptsG expression regulator)